MSSKRRKWKFRLRHMQEAIAKILRCIIWKVITVESPPWHRSSNAFNGRHQSDARQRAWRRSESVHPLRC